MQEKNGLTAQEASIKIQSFIRGVLTRERIKKKVKDLFTRKMIIKELLDTEENYIRDLSIVISDFQAPLLTKKIISKEESLAIFMNIDQIRRLNQLFFATIFEQATKYWHYKIIFEKVEKEIHFFKMYFEYFNNYTASQIKIDQLMQRKAFSNFIEESRLNPHHKLLSLKDFLIKPVQRLPKYVLIMKQIKKRTSTCHPDYSNIDRVLKMFQEVNQSNNDKLNRVLDTYKITQIQKKLSLPHSISEPGVEFVLEEPVTVITNEGLTVEATLYLLNTEIIVARKTGDRRQKFLASVPFKNGGANIMSNEEHFFYKDTFTVQNGEGDSCMFLCIEQEERQALIQKIYNQLMKAQQRTLDKLSALCNVQNKQGVDFLKKMTRLDLLPDVQILGTDQRSDNMFKYTVYIVQIRIKIIKQKIFLRFRQLFQLQQQLISEYGLTIKNQLIKTPWVTNHKPKRIEERKLAIQRFLKEILSKQEIIEHGSDILPKLGLPPDFYRLPQLYKDSEDFLKKSMLYQRQTSDKSQSISKSMFMKSKRSSIFASIHDLSIEEEQRPIRPRSRQISIQDILKANELHLGHFTRYTQILFPKKQKEETLTVNILIPWIQNYKGFVKQSLEMDKSSRIADLIEDLSRKIGLKYFKDFRMMLQRDYAFRILEDDECLAKVLEEMRCGKYLLILKKMIYVAADIEERQIRGDRIRLKIIASQIIYDCKKDKYLMDYHLMLRLSVLIGIAQLYENEGEQAHQGIDEILKNGDIALRTREMVCNSFTSFYDGPATWKQDYQATFKLVLQKLKAISRGNQRVFRTSGIKDEQKLYNTTQIGQLASILIIMSIKNNIFFGATSFVVQISQWFRKYLIKFGQEDEESYDNRNCWLIIKYNQLHLYSISLTTCIFTFNFNQLYKISTYPSSIFLHLRDRQIDFLKLKTTNSYSIRQMLMYYRNYNQIIRKMEEDEEYEPLIIDLIKDHHKEGTLIRSVYE